MQLKLFLDRVKEKEGNEKQREQRRSEFKIEGRSKGAGERAEERSVSKGGRGGKKMKIQSRLLIISFLFFSSKSYCIRF